jgi:predicted  nucleic acid-binding Zn-ribbon protein
MAGCSEPADEPRVTPEPPSNAISPLDPSLLTTSAVTGEMEANLARYNELRTRARAINTRLIEIRAELGSSSLSQSRRSELEAEVTRLIEEYERVRAELEPTLLALQELMGSYSQTLETMRNVVQQINDTNQQILENLR